MASFRYYRFQATKVRSTQYSNSLSLGEFELRNQGVRVTGMTVTAPGADSPEWNTGGQPSKAADNDPTTAWDNFTPTVGYLLFDFGTAKVADGYRIATGPDQYGVADRDPVSWVVSGSNDGATWTVLDTQVDYAVPTARSTWVPVTFPLAGGAPTVPIGTTTGSLSLVGVASGSRSSTGTASGSLSLVGVASGVAPVVGQSTAIATGSLNLVGMASASRSSTGTASGSLSLVGVASGSRSSTGTASGSLSLVGVASGSRSSTGTASGSLSLVGVASGVAPVVGQSTAIATGSLNLVGMASASRSSTGATSGFLGLIGVASGSTARVAAGGGELGLVGVASASRSSTGATSGSLSLIGVAAGSTARVAAGGGELGLIGVAAGSTARVAAGGGELGLIGVASGVAPVVGQSTAIAVGSLTFAGRAVGFVARPAGPSQPGVISAVFTSSSEGTTLFDVDAPPAGIFMGDGATITVFDTDGVVGVVLVSDTAGDVGFGK